ITLCTQSCERPRNRSASFTRPCGESNSYSFSTLTQGRAWRFSASASRFRVSSFSSASSFCLSAIHCSRVTTRCMGTSWIRRFCPLVDRLVPISTPSTKVTDMHVDRPELEQRFREMSDEELLRHLGDDLTELGREVALAEAHRRGIY